MDWLRSLWVPTSESLLEESESRILEAIKRPIRSLYIKISKNNTIRTIKTEGKDEKRTPLVLLHGFAAGLGFWALNIDSLSQQQSVYALDLLGFGRSSRPNFPTDSDEVEHMYVESIEEWKKELGVEKMVLCGHSFGAYLANAYALKHPESVEHLVLADPWGFPEQPPEGEEPFRRIGKVRRAIYSILSSYNPMSVLRLAGWYGPRLVERMRPDIKEKYEGVYGEGDTRIMNYIYHCNAQKPSGETAFMNLTAGKIPVYAKRPIVKQLHEVDAGIPITIIVGKDSWMMKYTDFDSVPEEFPDRNIDVQFIDDAGHHIYLDQKDEFNRIMCEVCDQNESRKHALAHTNEALE